MASVADWSTTPASNTTLGGISTDGNITLVNQIDNIFRGMMSEVATSRDDGTINATGPRGYLHGLDLSNNAGDATNDIDIAAGECSSLDSPYWRMALTAAMTKRLDAAWAVGTGNGGRMSAAAIANTTYHVWVIARSDTGVVDVGFDVSATAPTMPANYDRKRRIGSIMREGGVIVAFNQFGDTFRRGPATDRSATTGFASALLTLSVPLGIVVQPIMHLNLSVPVSAATTNSLGNAGSGAASTAVQTAGVGATGGTAMNTFIYGGFYTNTSAQLYFSAVAAAGSITANVFNTIGWIDNRGRT